ncbi:MAG: phosphatase PAP2 family protein [Endomicrobium sp.]|jgi:membrane-associated phospholipid phosphatase|nr:phosphatase PAP2 family protein [Endomicrobium sp.]
MKKTFLVFFTFFCFQTNAFAEPPSPAVSVKEAVNDIGGNIWHTFKDNYIWALAVPIAGTFIIVESELDWHYNRYLYRHPNVAEIGEPMVYIGYVSPFAAPVGAYLIGLAGGDRKLQYTGLALAQSLVLAMGTDALLKAFTGRASPGIIDFLDHKRNDHASDFSDDWMFGIDKRGFAGAGWPSGHTMQAVAAAQTIAEIYHDNMTVKIAAYSYAALMGIGVSMNVHWASDVFAGALIGYFIGKTVGKSFRALIEKDGETNSAKALNVSFSPNGVSVAVNF